MCGIAGFFGQFGADPKQQLATMLRRIRHRGPDDYGMFFRPDAGLGLGHALNHRFITSRTSAQTLIEVLSPLRRRVQRPLGGVAATSKLLRALIPSSAKQRHNM